MESYCVDTVWDAVAPLNQPKWSIQPLEAAEEMEPLVQELRMPHPLFTSCVCCLIYHQNLNIYWEGSIRNAIFPPRSNHLTALLFGEAEEDEAGGRRRRKIR